jgi:hypothetical protein
MVVGESALTRGRSHYRCVDRKIPEDRLTFQLRHGRQSKWSAKLGCHLLHLAESIFRGVRGPDFTILALPLSLIVQMEMVFIEIMISEGENLSLADHADRCGFP